MISRSPLRYYKILKIIPGGLVKNRVLHFTDREYIQICMAFFGRGACVVVATNRDTIIEHIFNDGSSVKCCLLPVLCWFAVL